MNETLGMLRLYRRAQSIEHAEDTALGFPDAGICTSIFRTLLVSCFGISGRLLPAGASMQFRLRSLLLSAPRGNVPSSAVVLISVIHSSHQIYQLSCSRVSACPYQHPRHSPPQLSHVHAHRRPACHQHPSCPLSYWDPCPYRPLL